ncbi:asparagine synthase (glutamine-hydrolyzing) [Aquisalimonas sp. 2447]|uniref:asparagine synthase (glutamine-hydrolyzing) n=1 Tax=Aquisalimonas sp. 2447 TaxID=2740807 RepID=UPI00143267F8|nr:asparagine synthase (glutamine-hydrolyzing) [Aquisalimonas sp. 2447]QIT56561.1 asparagine synthase (glutamine-hydrolyzing) [Aquisalimonas sp. 2447]
MCGIAGFILGASGDRATDARSSLDSMGQRLVHRGPDAGDLYFSETDGVGLVHRRLSIQDISPLGAQPMESASGRYLMVFNGEIYNFRTLRTELIGTGHSFRGHSDTEVMLAAMEQYGVEQALGQFKGMFAFGVWDRETGRLWLARDRMGEKPLYYGWWNGHFLFGSELKALRAFPGYAPSVDRNALSLLLRHNYIPSPYTVYQDTRKLPPAHCLVVDVNQPDAPIEPVPYWSLADSFSGPMTTDKDTVLDDLERCLGDVIQEQMVADVPLGAFLSGGIDSSAVVALMQQRASRPVKTFSIGFREEGYNEAQHAAAVAAHLGTEHTELYVDPADALDVIPDLPTMYDEPFADSSQIPTYLVSRMTRGHVTVALSGDGGDELFAGYDRYPGMARAWQKLHERPGLRAGLERATLAMPDALAGPVARAMTKPQRLLSRQGLADKLRRERVVRNAPSLQEFYRQRIGFWTDPAQVVLGGEEPAYALTAPLPDSIAKLSPAQQLMWLDMNSYLPDDILTKVDRAAMAVSLETRVPMLDHRVVEFALSLPVEWNLDGKVGKQVLRQMLYRHVPRELVDRPKQGFAVPVARWLRHELRDWAEALLEPNRLRQEGYFHAPTVRRVWSDHLAQRADYSAQLWGVLSFQAWLGEQRSGAFS